MAGPRTKDNGEIVRQSDSQTWNVMGIAKRCEGMVAQVLPKHVSADRMARIVLSTVRNNAKLQRCSPASFAGSILSAAALGLEPNSPLGLAYLVPYGSECTLILGYQGMLELARRSGYLQGFHAFPVYEGDTFEYELGLEPKIVHKPSDDPRRGDDAAQLTHVYAVATLKGGEKVFTVLNRAEVERRRMRSATQKNRPSGPWVTDYEAMALKTATRKLWRWLPKSSEMAAAAALDEAPELNQSQAVAYDPKVTEALAADGFDVTDTNADDTPEDTNEEPEREPGED